MNPIMALRAIFPRRRLAAPRLQDAAQFLDRVGREGQWAGAALGIGGRRQQRPAFVEPRPCSMKPIMALRAIFSASTRRNAAAFSGLTRAAAPATTLSSIAACKG